MSQPSGPNESASPDAIRFEPRTSVEQVEEGHDLAPKFDRDGLIACVTTDASSGEVLMLGYMNREALEKTIVTGEAHYWSRSRQVLWHKGATSGLVQRVVEMRIDDDQDAVWLRVALSAGTHAAPASCHVGYRSCFYRTVELGSGRIAYAETEKTFDPVQVYGDAPNPTLL
ncbi:phosphoribosyl-AMP cyclohydrolase [Methyloversatilis discipulorum]|uniref:phosphoribosyl-AMP cyclohydrolase n=1 Tax=Methyloversatilis discipulorum TaxID=1119528 RepID=UPI001A577E97|nr:phosphoribosyl-AMP cyclohydrolase [Methyloversatilis discipulorum]MBL8466223.1 phosphoribosyl-AMP cyclohydrolase [Methyloversatilis discipulorum]